MTTFRRVTLGQLRPALMAGALLVVLHVIGDFGVVSLMRFETFSYALYQTVESHDRAGAAWLGLMLVSLALIMLIVEYRFLRGLRLDPAAASTTRRRPTLQLGYRWPIACTFLILIAAAGLLVPLATMIFWATRSIGTGSIALSDWAGAMGQSVSVALPASIITVALAIPIAYLARRYRSRMAEGLERSVYLGYATPPLAFAIGFVFLGIHGANWLYQTFAILILAYALHFLAEAIGPVRSALYVATPRVEEAARSLGCGRWGAFRRVTFPLLKSGVAAGAALVFLSVIKELPITYILAPLDFHPLSLRVWDLANEARFADAAPFALSILLVSAAFVGLLLSRTVEEQA